MSTLSVVGELNALFTEVSGLAARLRLGWTITDGEQSISGGGSGVLEALGAEGAQTVPEIARKRHTSRQNIQIVVNRLKKSGLVQLEGNPAHKRSALVRLTEQGKSALSQLQQSESQRLGNLLSQLPAEELASTMRVLSQVREALARPGGGEFSLEQPKPRRTTPSKAVGSHERRTPPHARAVEASASEEEGFPLSLL